MLVPAPTIVDVGLMLTFDALEESATSAQSRIESLCRVLRTARMAMTEDRYEEWIQPGRARIRQRLGTPAKPTPAGVALRIAVPDALDRVLSLAGAAPEAVHRPADDAQRLVIAAVLVAANVPPETLRLIPARELMLGAVAVITNAADRRPVSEIGRAMVSQHLRALTRIARGLMATMSDEDARRWSIQATHALMDAFLDPAPPHPRMPSRTQLDVLREHAADAVVTFTADWNALLSEQEPVVVRPQSLLEQHPQPRRALALAYFEDGIQSGSKAPDDAGLPQCMVDMTLLRARMQLTNDLPRSGLLLTRLERRLDDLASHLDATERIAWWSAVLAHLDDSLIWRAQRDDPTLAEALSPLASQVIHLRTHVLDGVAGNLPSRGLGQ